MIDLTLFHVTAYANTPKKKPVCLILGSPFVAGPFDLFVSVFIYLFGPWTLDRFLGVASPLIPPRCPRGLP